MTSITTYVVLFFAIIAIAKKTGTLQNNVAIYSWKWIKTREQGMENDKLITNMCFLSLGLEDIERVS